MEGSEVTDGFDEREYRKAVLQGGERALRAAASAPSVLGVKGSTRETLHAILELDYSKEYSCAAVRALHSSVHYSIISGLDQRLPLLHAVFLSKFAERRKRETAIASSLTSSQLEFEFLRAVDREEWGRAASVAEQIAAREIDMLTDLFREVLARRQSVFGYGYSVFNALHCATRAEDMFPQGAVQAMLAPIAHSYASDEYRQIRTIASREKMDLERIAENSYLPDELEDRKLSEALRSGITEMLFTVLARQLKDGISVQHLRFLVSAEILRASHLSGASPQGILASESAASVMELAPVPHSYLDVLELFQLAAACTQMVFARSYVRRNRLNLETALSKLERGDASFLAEIVRGSRSETELRAILERVCMLSFKCDPPSPTETAGAHIIQSALVFSRLPLLKECVLESAELVASQFRRNENCGEHITKAMEKVRTERS